MLGTICWILSQTYTAIAGTAQGFHCQYENFSKVVGLYLADGFPHTAASDATCGAWETKTAVSMYLLTEMEHLVMVRRWSDLSRQTLFQRYAPADLLTNVSIYYFTRSITSSMRLYLEFKNKADRDATLTQGYIKAPVAVAKFPKEIMQVWGLTLTSSNSNKHLASLWSIVQA